MNSETTDQTKGQMPDTSGEEATRSDAEGADRFGNQSHGKMAAIYGIVILTGLALLSLVLRAGSSLRAPEPTGSEPAGGEELIDTHEVLWKLLLATAVVILAARLLGSLFRRYGQPQVVGEIAAGIVLGPSLLGALWPGATKFLFGPEVLPFIEILAQIGLVLFMFLIGVELDVRLIRGRGHAAAMVSHVSIVVPFLSGVVLALAIFSDLGSDQGDFVSFSLFLGASMSVTAFPVLARILTERGLNRTRLGAVTITCAAVDDITAWSLLAIVVAVAAAEGLASAFVTIALSMVFVAVMILAVRPFLARVAHRQDAGLPGTLFALILAGLLLSALATDRLGIHAIFGAFLFGAILPHDSPFVHALTAKLEDFSVIFLLPLFFAFSGLRTEIGLIGTDPQLWLFTLLVVLVAIAGKWGGSTLAARYVGLEWRESMALGTLMNCRGLTELVILNIGLDLGVIPPSLFAILVIMALVTTFMTVPVLDLVYPRDAQERMVAKESGGDDDEEDEEDQETWRVLVHLPNLDSAYELVHTALSLAPRQHQRVELVLVRTLQLPETIFGSLALSQDLDTERVVRALRPVIQFVEGGGARAVPLVVPTDSVGQTLVQVAEDRRPDLVLMSWRKPVYGSRLLAGSIGEVMRHADVDVAVLVDTLGRGTMLRGSAEVLVPYGGGYHESLALDLAVHLASTSRARLRLLSDARTERVHGAAAAAAASYERKGVTATTTALSGDVVEGTIEAARHADLVVLGVSDHWVDDTDSLGHLRQLVAERSSTPMLIVRKHGQQRRRGPRRWFGWKSEWMQESADEQEPAEVEQAQPV